jgi:hypothetical protein
LRTSEISNSKHPARRTAGKQISIKSKISISNDPNRFVILNFGHCDLFVICYLRFGIFHRNFIVSLTINPGAPPASGRAERGTVSLEPFGFRVQRRL